MGHVGIGFYRSLVSKLPWFQLYRVAIMFQENVRLLQAVTHPWYLSWRIWSLRKFHVNFPKWSCNFPMWSHLTKRMFWQSGTCDNAAKKTLVKKNGATNWVTLGCHETWLGNQGKIIYHWWIFQQGILEDLTIIRTYEEHMIALLMCFSSATGPKVSWHFGLLPGNSTMGFMRLSDPSRSEIQAAILRGMEPCIS